MLMWSDQPAVSLCLSNSLWLTQLLALLKSSAAHIQSPAGWRTICQLITNTSLHPDAAPAAFEALAFVASHEALSLASFQPCLATAVTIINRHSKVSTALAVWSAA